MTPPRPAAPLLARRTLLGGAGALLAGTALAACAEVAPPPAVPTGPSLASPTPAAGAEQLAPVVAEISEAVAAADAARDARLLAPRVVGTAAELRAKTYDIIGVFEGWADQLASYPGTEASVLVTSVSTSFPRSALALVPDAGDSGVPFFVALQQADARSPYTTWGWAQQAVGVDMPTVPADTVGSEPVAADADDLLMAPAAALELYAGVLSNGDGADAEDVLAPNPFQTTSHEQIRAERADLNADAEAGPAGTIHESYSVKEGDFTGLRTDDGGAIVMATLLSTRTVSVTEGATVSYAEDNVFTTLAGRTEFTKSYVREYASVVALHIPPTGSDQQIQPIAGTRTLLAASGS